MKRPSSASRVSTSEPSVATPVAYWKTLRTMHGANPRWSWISWPSDSGPENAPAYAAYRLLTGRRPEPQVHHFGRARRVVLMTDGFDALLETNPARVAALFDGELFRNPRTLQRRLNVLGEAAPPSDDATLVVLEGD